MADEPNQNQAAAPESDSSEDATKQPDALSKTNEELGILPGANNGGEDNSGSSGNSKDKPAKKLNPIKKFLKRFNVYLLMFLLVTVIGAAVAVVAYLNSKKEPPIPTLTNQTLDEETLRKLANTDATVGGSGQTLTIQGNAIIDGQALVRGNLNVAGTIQLGNALSVPNLTVSGTANLANVQIGTLQIAQTITAQGEVTLQNDLNVAGTSSFNGPVTIGELTVVKLTMGGNGQLEVPNHLNFTGPTPNRIMNAGILGAGGSASISGSDTTGSININTGIGASAGCFIRIMFNIPYTNIPRVLISPIDAEAGRLRYYVTRSATEFSICSHDAPQPNQNFGFDYFITGI